MTTIIIKLVNFLLDKLGMNANDNAGLPQKKSNIYMKRTVFVFAVLLSAWALISPESIAIKLEQASEIMPRWFVELLITVFAGVWS